MDVLSKLIISNNAHHHRRLMRKKDRNYSTAAVFFNTILAFTFICYFNLSQKKILKMVHIHVEYGKNWIDSKKQK